MELQQGRVLYQFDQGDINPDNLLLDRYGHLRLSDFGLCKPLDCSTLEETDFSTGDMSPIQQVRGNLLLQNVHNKNNCNTGRKIEGPLLIRLLGHLIILLQSIY